ncbi:sensor domain-containing diguanylate cyclase [Bacillus piscicola]|uniref:sensor domain-containing diguanylate cyclase n=1 Tax=Bacillus piscicola TaxID=1632684 RepID=UPI001F0907B1|nr:sensor domain-containing diguanylate cyclase [Bacillus piscicola]
MSKEKELFQKLSFEDISIIEEMLDAIYKQGYKKGFHYGYEEGYDEGKTEAEQAADQELLRTTVDGVIFTQHVTTNTIDFSEEVENLFGYPRQAFQEDEDLWKKIVHPDDEAILVQAEEELLTGNPVKVEYRILRADQQQKWISLHATPVMDVDGTVTKVMGQFIDTAERKQLEEKLKQIAYTDDLTDLPNRVWLDSHLQKAISRAQRHHRKVMVMFIDLDDFKHVNDNHGHHAGDFILQEVAERLFRSMRKEDFIARVGGDEFVAVFEKTSRKEVESIASRIINNISEPYQTEDTAESLSSSIGISVYPDDGEDAETLLMHADKAMYKVKHKQKNGFTFYSPAPKEEKTWRLPPMSGLPPAFD